VKREENHARRKASFDYRESRGIKEAFRPARM
jgi:hypothetical protein